MVQRIALSALALLILAGFNRPNLPTESRGIYRFDRYTGAALKTLSGGLFAVTVGFRAAADASVTQASHRQRAQELLDRAEAAIAGIEAPGTTISVARIYVDIREVTLSVEVKDAETLETVRERLLAQLHAAGDIAFAGEPKRASIE